MPGGLLLPGIMWIERARSSARFEHRKCDSDAPFLFSAFLALTAEMFCGFGCCLSSFGLLRRSWFSQGFFPIGDECLGGLSAALRWAVLGMGVAEPRCVPCGGSWSASTTGPPRCFRAL